MGKRVNSPANGAKVTVVGEHTGRLLHAEVWGHPFKDLFQWSDGERHSGLEEDDDEGVHWARGWLMEWDEEARALLAASKLTRSAE